MTVKILRTIRFDGTDDAVFEIGAPEAEFAISGALCFAGLTPEQLTGKTRQAFANGFFAVPSCGRSTFATVAEAGDGEIEQGCAALAAFFLRELGAPGSDEARAAAEAEIAFVRDLCADTPINTVFTVRRTLNGDGEIEEEFRKIKPPSGEPLHARVWNVVDDDDGA